MPSGSCARTRFVLLLTCLAALTAGCAMGMGPSTAATRPLLGQVGGEARMWVVSSNQTAVPSGFVRVDNVVDNFAKVFQYVSITSAAKMGSATATVNGVAMDGGDVTELDFLVTGRIPLPLGNISIGGGHVVSMQDSADLSGWGVRASVAPIAQLSIDLARSWTSGTFEDAGAATEVSGTHTSLGGTLLVWGYKQFRFGVALAKTWTDAGAYTSDGYTYTLVSTMY